MMFPISTDSKISVDALRGFLDCLPADARVVKIREDRYSLTTLVFVESSFFPEVGQGAIIPRVPLWITRHDTEEGPRETAEWRWTK
jgi:hypothetical protein